MTGFGLGIGVGIGIAGSRGGGGLPQVASISGFGSSSVEGVGATTTAQRFINILQVRAGASTLRNKGVGGTVLQGSNDSTGSPRANNGLSRYSADLLGANLSDLYFMTWPNDQRYTGAPATFNVAGYTRDFRRILNGMALAGIDMTKVYLGSPTWYDTTHYAIGSAGFTGSNDATALTYRQATIDLATEFGAKFADVYTRIKDNGGLSLFVASDVHWNDDGHAQGAEAFINATQLNSNAKLTGLSASSPGFNLVDVSASAPAGSVASYDFELLSGDNQAYAQNNATPSFQFTGVGAGAYKMKARANFSDGSSSPWAYYTTAVNVSSDTEVMLFNDTFVGKTANATLQTTTATQGTWTKESYSTGDALINASSAALRGPGTTSQYGAYNIGSQALGAGLYGEGNIHIYSNVAVQLNAAIALRMSNTQQTFILGQYNGQALRIMKYINGTATALATLTQTLAVGSDHVIRLEVEDGEQRMYLDGALILTANEPDSGMAGLGTGMGIRVGAGTTAFTSTTGPQFTNVEFGTL